MRFFNSEQTAEEFLENRSTIAKKVLTGLHPTIYTFGIFTPENPMGKQASNLDNSKSQDSFKKLLHDGHYQYTRIKGQYGNAENPWLIYNIGVDDLKRFGASTEKKGFNQESFIFGVVEEEGKVKFEYWEKLSSNSNFNLKDTLDRYENSPDSKDFFTSLKSWKFTIPFSIFESTLSISKEKLKEINDLSKAIIENKKTHEMTLKWEWMRRGYINKLLKEDN